MIKIMLKRRKESDTYLAADSRHRQSPQIAMKVDKVYSFQPALWPSSTEKTANDTFTPVATKWTVYSLYHLING